MKRHSGLAWLAMLLLALGFGVATTAQAGLWGSKKSKAAKNDDDEELDKYETADKVPLVGQFTQVVGQNVIRIEGAGLVVGLDGTGEDPPPSLVRQMVIADMKRRGVVNPDKLLKSPNVAVVIVTAYLPPLIRENETFDVEVSLPAGSKVKSLNGGYLMETYLAEHVIVPGQADHKGKEMATAKGPILVSSSHANTGDLAGVLKRGRIVAGGKSKIDRDLALYLRNDFRSERNAVRIATFHRPPFLRIRQAWPADRAGRGQDRSADQTESALQVPRQLSAVPGRDSENCLQGNRRCPPGPHEAAQMGASRAGDDRNRGAGTRSDR